MSATNVYFLSVTATGAGWNEGATSGAQAIALSAVPAPVVLNPSNPSGYDALFKVCDGANGWKFTGMSIPQGAAHSLDVDNGAFGNLFSGDIGLGAADGTEALMVKGGVHDCQFPLTIHSRCRFWDICIDQWMNKGLAHGWDKSYNLDFSNTVHADGGPLRFCFVHNHPNSTIKLPPNAKVMVLWSYSNKAWWYGNRAVAAF